MKVLQILMITIVASCMMIGCSDDGPSVSVTVDDADNTYAAGETISYTITVTDDTGISSIAASSSELGLDVSENYSTPEPALTIASTIITDVDTPAGDYDVEVTATDTDGNTDSATFSITIE